MPDTVRERILKQWKKNLEDMQDGGQVLFYHVERALIGENDFTNNAVSLIDGGETASEYEVGYILNTLRVDVVFTLRPWEGEDLSSQLNHIDGLIVKEFLSKIDTIEAVTGDALSLNIVPVSFTPDIEGPFDNTIEGARVFNILYRHAKQDPYELR